MPKAPNSRDAPDTTSHCTECKADLSHVAGICPYCGSSRKTICAVAMRVTHKAIKRKGKPLGWLLTEHRAGGSKKKRKARVVTSDEISLHVGTGKENRVYRRIDRERDEYHEVIYDGIDGPVAREVRQKLSEHLLHGDARPDRQVKAKAKKKGTRAGVRKT